MKFDRSKFKKQSIEDVEAEVKQAEKTMYKGGKSYTGFATVQKGKMYSALSRQWARLMWLVKCPNCV